MEPANETPTKAGYMAERRQQIGNKQVRRYVREVAESEGPSSDLTV